MPPKTPQPISTPNHFVIKLPKRLAYIGLVLVVLAVAGGFYWHNHSSSKMAKAPELYKYSYSKLNSYDLTGGVAGSGITFVKPSELGIPTDAKSKGNSISFSQTTPKNNQTIITSSLSAASVNAKTTVSYKKSVSTIITDPSNSSYQNIILPIQQFVASGIGYNYEVTFGTPVALSTGNLSSNAWGIDFTAKPVNPNSNPLLPNMQGKAVFAIGKNTYYYFYISAVDYNWQANQSVFDQVISSLKIDQ